ncbi:DNA-processing protein DprA [[Mycoplasma] mobile]|uniref:DNA processing protein smf n=1 Tax=Mycoplasma mobile (strain ATCC 43663 / 163K / NCTC 11711) TaxID=267748 RepID=Q6KHR8_MYCM1|nr:DNA-processing protein DprA [[Mycoplasma] mobile]AAT27860.1 DNA processing protein smf [Mycoplasma mobile 163K]
MKEIIIYFSIKYQGDYFKIKNALIKMEKIDIEKLIQWNKKLENNKIKVLTKFDQTYPNSFKNIKYSPYAIFYKGNIDLLNSEKIMLVGDSFEKSYEDIENSLHPIILKKTLLSLGFKNFDEKIYNLFKNNNGKIISFSANGLIDQYMFNEIDLNLNNLIISEYPFKINLSKRKLFKRNYLSSILSDFLIIYNSEKNSKLFNLINFFLNSGKEIFCFPPKGDDGNLILLNDGANFVTKIVV